MNVCEVCGSAAHPEWKAHVFALSTNQAINAVDNKIPVVVDNKSAKRRSGDRHKRTEARRIRVLLLMQARRAIASGRVEAWPR